MKRFNLIKISVASLFFVAVLILSVAHYKNHNLQLLPPFDYSFSVIDSVIPPPPRPGIQGIVITGPEIRPLYFQINRNPQTKSIDWNMLSSLYPNADIKFVCNINERGRLFIEEVIGSPPSAVNLIRESLITWAYNPYKTGQIRFWFNVASEGRQLSIDTREMIRDVTIDLRKEVRDGQLYYIDGLNSSKIGKNF